MHFLIGTTQDMYEMQHPHYLILAVIETLVQSNIKQICQREKHSRKNSEKQEYGWHLAKCIKCYVLSHKPCFNKEEGTTILKFQHSRATIIGKLQNLGKWKESATTFWRIRKLLALHVKNNHHIQR